MTMLTLIPLFKVSKPIKAVKTNPVKTGFKQAIKDDKGKILIGRNHAYGMPEWFKELEQNVAREFKDGADSIEVWIAKDGFPRGVVVPMKRGKEKDGLRIFGNMSVKTLNSAKINGKAGFNAFKK